MTKQLLIRISFLVSLILLTSILKGWLNVSYWTYWLGFVIGSTLPFLDHILYIYLLRPYELTSQRIKFLVGKKDLRGAVYLLNQTMTERKDLILHKIYFMAIFAILTFWVVTSSGSVLGRGIVLSFFLTMLLDQLMEMQLTGSLDNWFRGIVEIGTLDKKKVTYVLMGETALLLIFSFLF